MSVCLACESEGATNGDDKWWYDFSSTYRFLSGLRMTRMKYSMTLQRKGLRKEPSIWKLPGGRNSLEFVIIRFLITRLMIPFYNSIWPQEQQRPRIGVWVFTGAFKEPAEWQVDDDDYRGGLSVSAGGRVSNDDIGESVSLWSLDDPVSTSVAVLSRFFWWFSCLLLVYKAQSDDTIVVL